MDIIIWGIGSKKQRKMLVDKTHNESLHWIFTPLRFVKTSKLGVKRKIIIMRYIMKKLVYSSYLFLALLLLIQCKSTTTAESSSELSFTPLSVGDITQIIFTSDSSTTLFSMIGTTKRKDGKEIIIGTFKYGTQEPDTFYYLLSDGYFITSRIDSVTYDSSVVNVNPFREQRLAKSYPESGDSWLHTIGDPDSIYWIAEKQDTFSSYFGNINDVFKFTLYENMYSPFLNTYYAKNMGWIGSTSFGYDSTEFMFKCSYKKILGKVYGELWPEKDISGFKTILNKNQYHEFIQTNILGVTSKRF